MRVALIQGDGDSFVCVGLYPEFGFFSDVILFDSGAVLPCWQMYCACMPG